jgi:hypothetical protein
LTNARLTLVEAPVANSDLPFVLAAELKRVRLVEYSVNGKDEEKGGHIDEEWTVNYDEISFKHSALDPLTGKTRTITSTDIKRSAQASTVRIGAVDDVVNGFKKLESTTAKDDAAEKMNNLAPASFAKAVKKTGK